MTPICVVQARMGSRRLPGKVLMDLAGQPAIGLQLARLRRGRLPVVVATSDLAQDDPLASFVEAAGVEVLRGSETDVLSRFAAVAAAHPEADTFVRLTADCPFTDPAVVDQVLAVHQASGADHTSNSLVRTYPDGFDVEAVSRAALLEAAGEATKPEEREHVTPFVIRRPERFALATICSGAQRGDLRLTLDTADDLAVLREAAAAVADPVTARWNEFPRWVSDLPPSVVVSPRCTEGRFERRSFIGRQAGQELGQAHVTVRSGTATVTLHAPEPKRAVLEEGVRRWLAMDLQAERIVVVAAAS